MTRFRDEFSIPSNRIFLNNGTMSFSPRCVTESIAKHRSELENHPPQGLLGAWPKMWQAQLSLASFLNCRPEDLFIRANVTYAMNDFLLALKLPEKSEIVTSDTEYGAISNICRYKAELDGHSLKTIRLYSRESAPETIDEKLILRSIEQNLSPRTRLLVLSHVMTGSGLTLPIERIAELCQSRGIIFAVDGAHGAGGLALDLSKTKVDFYGSNLHKWMMGPKGAGFGWVAPRVRELLQPQFAGWTTYDPPPHFLAFGGGDAWTLRWMICSTHAFSDFYGITAATEFWKRLGSSVILAEQKRLREFAKNTVEKKAGWKCLSRFAESLQGPLIAFDLPTRIAEKGFELINQISTEHQIDVAMLPVQDKWCLRLAPQIYNTEEEIDRAAAVFAKL